jgi:phenylacetate-CoA ligase
VQNLGISLFGVVWKRRRYGGCFKENVYRFIEREKYDPNEWREYQEERLRKLLRHSLENVPYYSEIFKKMGLSSQDLNGFSLEDLQGLPTLQKEEIRRNPKNFIAANEAKKKLHTYLTSGTTGTPLAVKFTTEMHRTLTAAYEARCRRWAGVNYKMSRAMIGGRIVVPEANANPPFWRYNRAERQLYMSAFHILPRNVPFYVEALNSYKPDYLVGYASSHFFLARMIREMKLKTQRPKAVLTSSEKLTEEMRETIQDVYGCEVFDAYSGVEACCLAAECEHHRLHLSPDVGIVELLDEKGNPVPSGDRGEIVATGLLNFSQPLIRYRTGDMAAVSDELCPCGRKMPVLKQLVGRLEDTVVGKDGREMVRFHGIFVGLPHVKEGQVIQEGLTDFRLRLVVDRDFGTEERRIIEQRFRERLGSVLITYEIVEKIERTTSGKFRAVISKVRRSNANDWKHV